MGNTDNIYFANKQGRELTDALNGKITTYRNYVSSSGQKARWGLALGSSYGVGPDGKISWQVTPGGEFGELIQYKVNDYASLVEHEVTLAVDQRPAGIAKAVNDDAETLRNARIGSLIVEYYLTDPAHDFEKGLVEALRLALHTSESFIVLDWDTALGDDLRPDEKGKMLKQGDLSQKVYGTWNVARDICAPSPDQDWYIFSGRYNKWNLAAKYEGFFEELTTASQYSNGVPEPVLFAPKSDDTDYIEVHLFIHFKTDACPGGKYVFFFGDNRLIDTDYPYKKKNVFRCSDRDVVDSAFSHTKNYDLLALEQMTDMLHSSIGNNEATYGVPPIIGPKGAGVDHQQFGKGGRYIEVDPKLANRDTIFALELTKTPAEIFNYEQRLSTKKGEISGINSILRGDPQGQLKAASGAAMALLQSQAITQNSPVQRSFYKLLSNEGTGIIEMLGQFSDDERIIKLVGKSNAQAVKEFKFTSDTLSSISTIVFEPVSPVLQTSSGKLTIAETLLEMGQVDGGDYVEVLTTGNLSVVTQKVTVQREAIQQEGEFLMEGKPVMAVLTENHQKHIENHSALISQPNAKLDPQLINRVLQHIQEHLSQWQMLSATNPALLIATGQQVLPVGPQVPSMQGGAPQPGAPTTKVDGAPMREPDGQPSLPNPPVNPATGEPAPVAPGTDVR